jgi:hypothetical protein
MRLQASHAAKSEEQPTQLKLARPDLQQSSETEKINRFKARGLASYNS